MTNERASGAAEAASSRSQLLRGLRVLEELAAEPRSAAAVARSIGVNRSTALRVLAELEDAGYLRRDDRTKAFSLRPERFYRLIVNHPDHRGLIDVLTPALDRLSSASGEACMFAAPANGTMVYIAYHPSPNKVTISERIGTVRPMHCSAIGKAYLSALDDERLDRELGRLDFSQGSEQAAKGPLELRARLQDARARGYAIDRDETFLGGSCVAAPLYQNGAPIGAIGISGPTVRLSDERLEELGVLLLAGMPVFGEST